jgi:hypothetical protein
MRIFEIGVMKTGTTSLGKAFRILGFKHVGWRADCYLPEPYPNNTFKDSWPAMCEVADKYETFTDGPWHDVPFQLWDKRYPGSKFIILERDDESWGKSNEFWQTNVLDWDKQWESDRDGAIENHLNHKRTKYDKIKNYFKDRPDDLLVMNICDGDGWEVLCPFLDKPIPAVSFPHLNITIFNG